MKREFILSQTSIPEKQYKSKVLIGNWQEERSEPNSLYSQYYLEQKHVHNQYQYRTLTKVSPRSQGTFPEVQLELAQLPAKPQADVRVHLQGWVQTPR